MRWRQIKCDQAWLLSRRPEGKQAGAEPAHAHSTETLTLVAEIWLLAETYPTPSESLQKHVLLAGAQAHRRQLLVTFSSCFVA
jgi:hypothetical protein